MPEATFTEKEPLIIVNKTTENGQPVTIVDCGDRLGSFKLQGWETPHPDTIQGGILGLKVNRGDFTLEEAQRKTTAIDYQRQRNQPRKPGHPQPLSRNYAAVALSLVAGPIPRN